MSIANPDGSEFHPTLVLVGTRLGIDKITPVYWEALIASLQMSQSVGIAGCVKQTPFIPALVSLIYEMQWSSLVVPLLYRCTRILSFLPRSSSHKTGSAVLS